MVDLQVENVKKMKKNKRKVDIEENESPKKAKKEKSILKAKNENEGGKKKSLKFDESVKVREIAKAPKKDKKEKLDKKVKDKKLFKKKDKKGGEEKKPFEKLDKEQTRDKQKKEKAERKAKKLQQEVFDIGVQAKKIWEEVRKEDCPEQKKEKLTTDLHALVKGNIKKIIFAHDTVRVVECLMAMGTQEIKDALYQELKEDIIEMAKSKYANFFVQKLLRYGSKDQKNAVMKAMMGNTSRLMKHKTAGVVVELAYNDYANANQRNSMLQEFLGPEYRLFKEPEVRTVEELVAKHPEKKVEMVKNLKANVETLIQKGCYNHSLVHTVIHNYLSVAEGKGRTEVIESLRDCLVHMIHSKDGAMAALYCLWHGTTKDRKSIVKSLKTFVEKTAYEEYGHMVLMAIFDTVDDTKLVGKAIIGELCENFVKIIQNKFGLRVVKYLVAGRNKTYTFPDALAIMEKGDGNEHSKKDPAVRRKELAEAASGPILNWLGERLQAGLYDPPSTITITCILNSLPHSPQLSKVWGMLAEEASKPFIEGEATPNIIENTASNMLLKKIILKDKERDKLGVETFAKVLLSTVDQDGIEAWLGCNRGAFVLVYCWETEIGDIQQLVRDKIKPLAQTLRKQKHKGASILVEKLG
eukprot:TRINITY_DN4384_c0_g1_i1.p1 TRINITY_DN4384_c0_g1~~TRINITY_DN4384_c0_g1_i1.p1  ORF type:complete len:639 (-),score=253.64 TRINITY_DN4384_c0_g1_i1:48-1964(-)